MQRGNIHKQEYINGLHKRNYYLMTTSNYPLKTLVLIGWSPYVSEREQKDIETMHSNHANQL